MNENEQSVFTRYAGKPQAKLEVIDGGKQTPGKSAYRAYGIDKPNSRKSRLQIEFNSVDPVIVSLTKTYLVEIQYIAERYVCLMFTTCAFLLEGENLGSLVELLNDDQVLSIHAFNPRRHDIPNEGEAIITHISRSSLQGASMIDEETLPEPAE